MNCRILLALALWLISLPVSATTMLLTGAGTGVDAIGILPTFRFVWESNSVTTGSPTSPLTLPTQSIGIANANRFVVVAATWDGAGLIPSVTINGVAANQSVYSPNRTGCCGPKGQGIWISSVKVPSGATASVAFSGWDAGQVQTLIAEVGTLRASANVGTSSIHIARAYPSGSGTVTVPVILNDEVFIGMGTVDTPTTPPAEIFWQGITVDNQIDDGQLNGLTGIIGHMPVTDDVTMNIANAPGLGNWGWVGVTYNKQ